MIVLFFLLISSLPLHLSASKFWPIPIVLKHEFVGTKQGCLKGISKRIAQFLIIQGDNQIAVPFETGGSQSCMCSGDGNKPTVQIETSQPRSSTRKVKLI
jgi:hypothetical protein